VTALWEGAPRIGAYGLSLMTLVPPENAEVIARRFGAAGEQFLRELAERLADIATRWELQLGEALPLGIGGYLVAAQLRDGQQVVLKVSPTGGEKDVANELEAYALKRWQGDGAVELLKADASAGTLLVERCIPGAHIDTLNDDEMLTVGCELARRLHRTPDAEDARRLPDAAARAVSWATEFEESMDRIGHPLSAGAERVVRQSHEDLARDVRASVVCHGDMNPGNLLAAQRLPWLAVDPLPVLADAAYDAASLVWSKRPWLLIQGDPAAVLERRIHLAARSLGTDAHRVWAWTLVLLTAILVDRSSWGGFDETPLVAVAELLCERPPSHSS
jgi:streptomycin 6-kinase